MILDTNALSALVDGDEALEAKLDTTAIAAIPVVVLGEYRYGIGLSRHSAAYEAWLKEHLGDFDVLPIDPDTTKHYASVRQELRKLGRPTPENDVWIAALARQHRMTIVTRDRHFEAIPNVKVLDW